MYSPQYAIQLIIRKNPFATVIYSENNIPQSFQLPLILEGTDQASETAAAMKKTIRSYR